MEAQQQQDLEQKPAKEPFSVFRVGQSASLLGATLLLLRGFNRFATQRQRLKAFASSGALFYTAVSIEMGWFPFSFAVSERIALPNKKAKVDPVAQE
uniref:HIG1 domain-containing protein n=1 Tax=Steinernema glaseri TaxID=37863 RepID=A0A1I7Z4J2_9BILA